MECFDHDAHEDELKAENEFLKMKLMLEHGANFGNNGSKELPAELENIFLSNIVAFEKQFQEHKTIRVFDKIGRPAHFKPVNEIPDSDIKKAWKELRNYLNEYAIDLDVCSPNITVRELYRFAIEELFNHETDDMDLPGWTTNFIYDEFYPDPVYDNTRIATDHCIKHILRKELMEWTHHFRDEGLRLNDHFPLSIEAFKNIISRFKSAYDNIEMTDMAGINCTVKEKLSNVTGTYSLTAIADRNNYALSGKWKVVLEFDEESGYWYIIGVEITGINF